MRDDPFKLFRAYLFCRRCGHWVPLTSSSLSDGLSDCYLKGLVTYVKHTILDGGTPMAIATSFQLSEPLETEMAKELNTFLCLPDHYDFENVRSK